MRGVLWMSKLDPSRDCYRILTVPIIEHNGIKEHQWIADVFEMSDADAIVKEHNSIKETQLQTKKDRSDCELLPGERKIEMDSNEIAVVLKQYSKDDQAIEVNDLRYYAIVICDNCNNNISAYIKKGIEINSALIMAKIPVCGCRTLKKKHRS